MFIIIKLFLTTKQIKLIEKKKFTVIAFNLKDEVFIVYVAFISHDSNFHFSGRAHIAYLKTNEISTFVLSKYVNFTDVYSKNLIVKLSEYTKINDHIINLIKSKQPFYELIFTLRSMKLENLKTYIKTNLANSFIRHFKFSASVFIFFIKKPDSNLQLYINY